MPTRVRRGWAMACTVVLLVVMAVVYGRADTAEAISGADFDAGYIISDERFFDNGSMTEAAIQQFLSSQVPRCLSVDASLPCLPNLITSTSGRSPASNGCAGYASEGWESAARILFKVAQSCRINAQVLIVMLQKEQSLVTATRPTPWQYRAAMGADCPDTAPCSATTNGFFNQVYKAAWQMRQYTYSPSSWRHRVGNTSVLYSPNQSCGSSVVNIRNQATANLYNYTPYQPNAASLANLYGTGDSCSTYGNRNFWRFFTVWFGSTTARGTTPIDNVYTAMGGAAGVLGAPTSDYIAISTASGAGTGRAYSGGSIYWSSRTGAAAVIEPFRSFYFGYGGATGPLSWPNSQSAAIPGKAGGAGQSYLNGSVYTSDATGIHSVIGATRSAYFGTGGALGYLGWPTTEAQSATGSGTTGSTQSFEGGLIASAPGTGTYPIPAAIAARYTAGGGPGSAAGWPISAAYAYAANGGGSGQMFQGASIYSSAAGAFGVSGVVRDVYFGVGGATGWLGWPTSDAFCIAGGVCWQHFQGASIRTDSSGTRVALAAIEDVHTAAGGDTGPHGARSSGLVRIAEGGGGYGQVYRNASIYFSSRTGAHAVSGGIREYYWSQRGAAGPLGFPTGPQACGPDSTCSQPFAGGTVFWSPAHGAFVSSPAIATVYLAQGGPQGPLGPTASGVIAIPENGGGIGQAFRSGSIYSSGAGTFVVAEPLRGGYFARGGAAGALGWPAGAMSCTAAGACVQAFQFGSLAWDPATGFTTG